MATVAEIIPNSKPQAFLDVLRTEVGRMQASHPDREGEIARANALIVMGMVTPNPDDPTTGQVLSSDGKSVYSVNGHCDCPAGQRGRDCKHVHGWRLYQYIERKLAAQEPQEVASTIQPNAATSGTTIRGTELPEAPASVNVRVTIAGREVQWTLRDTDEARLATRLEALLARYPVPAPVQPQSGPQRSGKDFCALHHVTMKLNHGKGGRTWYSHQIDGQWCKGR